MVQDNEGYFFIGRQDIVAQLLRGLDPGQSIRADDVSGAHGMGKSALMAEVRRRSGRLHSAAIVAHVDLGQYEAGSKGRGGGEQTYGQSLKSHDQLMHLAKQVVSAVSPASISRIEQVGDAGLLRVHQIKNADVNVYAEVSAGSSATVSDSPQHVTVNVDNKTALDASFVQAIRQAQVLLTDALISCLNETARDRPVLLLLDNADTVVGQDLWYWISRMISRLQGCVVVLAHEPDSVIDLSQGLGETFRLPPFSREEVAEFLTRKLAQAPAPDLVALLHEWTGGVPVALEILVDLMNDPDMHLGREELETRLSRLPGNAEARLARVVTEMVERLEGRLLGKALRAASIPEECDIDLLTQLLADDGVSPDEAPGLMKSLEAFSFTEEYDSVTDDRHYIALHPFIRGGLSDHMRKYAPSEQERLHSIAAEFFYGQLTGFETYDSMFGLEKPAQQARLRKWLYHSAHSGDRRTAILQAAKVFLDTFWWWGSYVHFEFCEKLAADFDNLVWVSGDEDNFSAFAGAVRRFISNYPYRAKLRQDFDRAYPQARWDQVEDALLEIRELCGLAMEPDPGTTELECHVAAVLEAFLAHTYRFATPADRVEARKCYARAERWFDLGRREWDVPWVIFERGDLALEDGDLALALSEATSAVNSLYAVLDKNSPDEELIANIHRLRADCAWLSDDISDAAREYSLAVVHSYLFHRIGGPPDDYTMQFYFEVRGRAIEKMLQLWRGGRITEALRFGHTLHEPFALARAVPSRSDAELKAICEKGFVSELAMALFPRGPEIIELGPNATSSSFIQDLRRFQRRLGESVVGDLAKASPA
ncbi:hypothetical protein [Mycetocola sp. 2940]|uniref:hypothetical protein n=1 Tax=Mycetocola sp. 2940 TaxID=3156452 RepID=UPI00339B9B40